MDKNSHSQNKSKEPMSVQEAGHLGGEARAEKYSHEELSEQAKRAADTVEKEHPGFHSEIGKKGGEKGGHARAEKYSHDELSEQAKRAAQTVEKEHPGFHAEIGKKGGEARGNQRQEDTQDHK